MGAKGRDKEARLIRDANVASAVGRLLLGEITSWQEFLEPDLQDYSKLPRKQLKSGKIDIQNSLSARIEGFCKSNFKDMTANKLVMLYEELKAHRRLEIPYQLFCKKYSTINNFHKRGYPEHSTVCISLWGLQYRFPEHDFSRDLEIALNLFSECELDLENYDKKEHIELKTNKDSISALIGKSGSSKRQIMQAAFSLLECYLNGLAWSYYNQINEKDLSKTKASLLQDTSNVNLRDKIKKYPKEIFNIELDESHYQFLLDEAKPYRDSLMHPSPFSAPEKFGGYNKLEKLYNLDKDVVTMTVFGVINLVEEIEKMKGKDIPVPIWLPELKAAANQALQPTPKSGAAEF